MSRRTHDRDEELMRRIRARLDQGVDSLDEAAIARLAEARRLAVAAAAHPRRRSSWQGPVVDRADEEDEALLGRVRGRLDAGVDDLDRATLTRLAESRRLAVAAAARPRGAIRLRGPTFDRSTSDWLVPAGAFASVVATALALTLMVKDPGDAAVDDLELLSAGEDIELYENLEFYQWLQDRERAG